MFMDNMLLLKLQKKIKLDYERNQKKRRPTFYFSIYIFSLFNITNLIYYFRWDNILNRIVILWLIVSERERFFFFLQIQNYKNDKIRYFQDNKFLFMYILA